MELTSNSRPKSDSEHRPCKASPGRIVPRKYPVAGAYIVLDLLAEDVVME